MTYRDLTPSIAYCSTCNCLIGCVMEDNQRRECRNCPLVGDSKCTFRRWLEKRLSMIAEEKIEICPTCQKARNKLAELVQLSAARASTG